jgi:hypothetical protein
MVCGFSSILIFAIEPPYSSPWSLNPDTAGTQVSTSKFASVRFTDRIQFVRWIVIELISVVLDVCIMCFPVIFLRRVQMSNSRKLKVICGFEVRFL